MASLALRQDLDGDRRAAAVLDLRNRDPQLAVAERGPGLRRVRGARQADHAGEMAVAPFDEVKTRLAMSAARFFLAGDQDAVALADHPDRGRIDAGEVDGNLDRLVGLVDVNSWRTLAGQRLGAEHAAKLEEHQPDFVAKVADFCGKRDSVNAGTHPLIMAQ